MLMRPLAAVAIWLLLAAAFPGPGEGEAVAIAAVGDAPGTLVLDDGRVVRLAGLAEINPAALRAAAGTIGALYPANPAENRYRQILAHIVLPDGAWLQEQLVREGRAVVMPFYETRMGYLEPLLAAERLARGDKAGMWARPGGVVVCAGDAKRAFDRFAIIQGRVLTAATVRGTTYFNFGEDYRKDFTIKISARALKTLPPAVRALLTDEANAARLVEVRGYVFYSGGPMIEVTSPAQISLLENDSPQLEESCS